LTPTEAGHRRVKYDGNWSAERGGVSQRCHFQGRQPSGRDRLGLLALLLFDLAVLAGFGCIVPRVLRSLL